MKRKLLDCGENDQDAKELHSIMNLLFHEDYKHTIGVNGWTIENNLKYPHYQSVAVYRRVAQHIENGCEQLIEKWKQHSPKSEN